MEDNVELARFLKAILSPLYRVDTASNGEEGITMATLEVPDLIISDVMMPIKDGYELCSALKSDFRTNHIPIILLTARADSDAKISGFQKEQMPISISLLKKKNYWSESKNLLSSARN
ncbi:MAG: response regulator [Saprospiraceae bacterium]|nr:response regulator [Saprospiraceae bacterium]